MQVARQLVNRWFGQDALVSDEAEVEGIESARRRDDMAVQEITLDLNAAVRMIDELAHFAPVTKDVSTGNPIDRARKRAQAIYDNPPPRYSPAISKIEAEKSKQAVLDLLTAASLLPEGHTLLSAIKNADKDPIASEFLSHRLNIPIGYIALRQLLLRD